MSLSTNLTVSLINATSLGSCSLDLDDITVWYDYCCLPQRSFRPEGHTPEEAAIFTQGLRQLPTLGAASLVLCLKEGDYTNRAWCAAEHDCGYAGSGAVVHGGNRVDSPLLDVKPNMWRPLTLKNTHEHLITSGLQHTCSTDTPTIVRMLHSAAVENCKYGNSAFLGAVGLLGTALVLALRVIGYHHGPLLVLAMAPLATLLSMAILYYDCSVAYWG